MIVRPDPVQFDHLFQVGFYSSFIGSDEILDFYLTSILIHDISK